MTVEAHAAEVAGLLQLDVRLQLDAHPMPLVHTDYVMQEISAWRLDGIAWLAVNDRYRFDGQIVRQQWDMYNRVGDALEAYRVQGKRLADFRRRHPGFVQHWDPDRFGDAWIADYPHAAADRRPDLDLRHDLASIRTPLALSFYWLRWLSPNSSTVSVFLPGFKEQKRAELPVGALTPAASDSVRQAPIHYPYLSPKTPSTASVRLSPDRHVVQLVFDLHGVEHSARVVVDQEGCVGSPPMPPK